MTTFTSYGQVPQYRQSEIMAGLAKQGNEAVTGEKLSEAEVQALLSKMGNALRGKLPPCHHALPRVRQGETAGEVIETIKDTAAG